MKITDKHCPVGLYYQRELAAGHNAKIQEAIRGLEAVASNIKLSDFEWSTRAKNQWEWVLKLETALDVLNMSRSELMRTPNFGRKCLDEVYDMLRATNLMWLAAYKWEGSAP